MAFNLHYVWQAAHRTAFHSPANGLIGNGAGGRGGSLGTNQDFIDVSPYMQSADASNSSALAKFGIHARSTRHVRVGAAG